MEKEIVFNDDIKTKSKTTQESEGAEINSPLCAEINPLPPDYESQQDYGIDI